MKLEELFRRIADAYDLPTEAEAGDGVHVMEMDGLPVAFRELPGADKMVSWTEIAPRPKDGRLSLYRALLEQSFLGGGNDGASFALMDDMIVLTRVDSLADADMRQVMEIARSLVECAKPWIEKAAEVNHDAE